MHPIHGLLRAVAFAMALAAAVRAGEVLSFDDGWKHLLG